MTPCDNDEIALTTGPFKPVIGAGANRILSSQQRAGIGCAKRKKIDQQQGPVPPVSRESDAAPEGWVIYLRIRS